MRLGEALNLLQSVPIDAEPMNIYLACGFTPLHLKTLLAAEIWQLSRRKAEIESGLYGDLSGSLRKAGRSGADFLVCLVEWSDLDPRLGIRSLGGWLPALFPDITENANRRMLEFEQIIAEVSATVPVTLSCPTLPLPPISFTSKEQAGSFELELRASIASSAVRLSRLPNVKVLNLTQASGPSEAVARFDVKSELLTGFPYDLSHAAMMARMLSRLITELPLKKGLITDLDDTLWKGLVGEVGPDGIGWTLDQGAQIHGLYQQLLAALAGAGVLLSAASKNDPAVVEAAFARKDLILTKNHLFPIEANWEPKSRSVARILSSWNISADAVIFVDDSPTELAEVAASHPAIECLQFPTRDWNAAYRLLEQIRDRFGKSGLAEEDLLRAQSLRRNTNAIASLPLPSYDRFLEETKPELRVQYSDTRPDARTLELINKTNQFNLNGKRHTYRSLCSYLETDGGFIMSASYKDKYGPLGKIAVVCGSCRSNAVHIETWVMSCRAFSRRIEYWCLEELFERFGAHHVTFDFQLTQRNSPLRDFLADLLGEPPAAGCKLSRADFQARCSGTSQSSPDRVYA
jgi:FkbH-like protein